MKIQRLFEVGCGRPIVPSQVLDNTQTAESISFAEPIIEIPMKVERLREAGRGR